MDMSNCRVLDVGNCGPDYRAIRAMLDAHFVGVELVQAHGREDSLQLLKQTKFDLVLINRKLDRDYSDGIEVLKAIKADPQTADVPVMLVTNFEEHQQAAIELGALRGFGKLELSNPATIQRLASALETTLGDQVE